MIELTPEIRDEILHDLRKTRAPARTSRNTGYPIRLVLQVHEEDSQPRTVRQEIYGGYGRPEVQQFIVARKRAWEVWNNEDNDIATARNMYEAGTVEMCTGRDGDWLILYAIPRQHRDPNRAGYFLPENLQ